MLLSVLATEIGNAEVRPGAANQPIVTEQQDAAMNAEKLQGPQGKRSECLLFSIWLTPRAEPRGVRRRRRRRLQRVVRPARHYHDVIHRPIAFFANRRMRFERVEVFME